MGKARKIFGKVRKRSAPIRKVFSLDRYGIPVLIVLLVTLIIVVVYYTQQLSEQTSLPPIVERSSKEQ